MSTPDGGKKSEITLLLEQWSKGESSAFDRLYPVIAPILQQQARGYLRREGQGPPLQTTDLVQETLLRLLKGQPQDWQSRQHFYVVTARIMRHILVDCARKRMAVKLDTLSSLEHEPQIRPAELVALDTALETLGKLNPRLAQIVELRFFVGLNYDEIAQLLGLSHSTVAHEWLKAKAWLCGQFDVPQTGGSPTPPAA